MMENTRLSVNGCVLITAFLSLCLLCVNDPVAITDNPVISAVTITIYEKDGKKPAAGATVKIFDAAAIAKQPAATFTTDDSGRFSAVHLPDGEYNIWAEKMSFILFQGPVLVTPTHTTLHDDTLECPSELTVRVGIVPGHDPRTVTMRIAGSDKQFSGTDAKGRLTLPGLAGGTYSCLFECSLPDYLPATETLSIKACTVDSLGDTIRFTYTGIPIVSDIRTQQDTLSGTITVSWAKTSYTDFQDYLLYKNNCTDTVVSKTPFYATPDTFFVDSVYCSLFADTLDTIKRCQTYRIAVRNNRQETGPTWYSVKRPFVPKAYVHTFFSNKIRNKKSGNTGFSINDSIVFSLTASNRTRPLRTLIWYDPVKRDTIMERSYTDKRALSISDSLCYAFSTPGSNFLLAIVADDAGTEWCDTLRIYIANVPKVSYAGGGNGP